MKTPKFALSGLVKIPASFLLAAWLLALTGCHSIWRGSKAPAVISGFSSPESIVYAPEIKRYLVSNVGEKLEPSLKDSDGFISMLAEDGTIVERRYLPKDGVLHAPKGMAIIGNTLYVADIDMLIGFDLTTREKTFEMDFSGEKTIFLNDLAALDENTLALSATDTGKVFMVSLKAKTCSVLAEGIAGPNGLYYDAESKRLFVVGFGEGYKANGGAGFINLREREAKPVYKKLTDSIGALDGVALLPGGRLMFSDWVSFEKPGALRVYDLDKKELSTVKLSEDVRGPADFYYDAKHKKLYLPRMLEGKLSIECIK
ncbi:MAG: hypothetical protein HY887_04180 [Deltaproteobacteria bacterium]|nr:hypothetical protein [Deltaproteobacteria bacterium]